MEFIGNEPGGIERAYCGFFGSTTPNVFQEGLLSKAQYFYPVGQKWVKLH